MAEMNGKYVNEEKHQQVKRKLNKVGVVLLCLGAVLSIVGIVLVIIGFTSFANSMGDMNGGFGNLGLFVAGGFLMTIGFGMFGYGVYAVFFAHARDIAAFGASTVAPVVGETANYLAEETSPAIEKVVGAVAKGIKAKPEEANTNATTTPKAVKYCTNCGEKNSKTAKFCSSCGTKFDS